MLIKLKKNYRGMTEVNGVLKMNVLKIGQKVDVYQEEAERLIRIGAAEPTDLIVEKATVVK